MLLAHAAHRPCIDSDIQSGVSTTDPSSPLHAVSAHPNLQGDPTMFMSTSQASPQPPQHTSSDSDATETGSDSLLASDSDTDDESPKEFPEIRTPLSKCAWHI